MQNGKELILNLDFSESKKSFREKLGDVFRSTEEIERRDREKALKKIAKIGIYGFVFGASFAIATALLGSKTKK